jgi:hypothetical protein
VFAWLLLLLLPFTQVSPWCPSYVLAGALRAGIVRSTVVLPGVDDAEETDVQVGVAVQRVGRCGSVAHATRVNQIMPISVQC